MARKLVLLGLIGLVGCAESAYDVKPVAEPAMAKGDVLVNGTESNEVTVLVTLEDLLPPESHGEHYHAYVVWLRPMGMDVLRAGQLSYHRDAHLGVMRLRTPYSSFELMVTAEPRADVAAPGPVVVDRRIVQRAR